MKWACFIEHPERGIKRHMQIEDQRNYLHMNIQMKRDQTV
jgi:hypothetical protein